MSQFAPHIHPPGYRPRRGLNWVFIGLLYTSFYMCRYNLSIANGAISREFGFSKADMGAIITTALLAYAVGQILNGLLTDRLGGKRAMLMGAAGTIVMNILFGVASFWGLLWLFVTIRGIDGYMQAFGAPGMIKINAAWFGHRERGKFAGIFGFMINLGRFGIFTLGPALLAGFTIFGLIQVPPLHWRWLFWVPSGICTIVAIGMAIFVDETSEAAGYPNVIPGDRDASRFCRSFQENRDEPRSLVCRRRIFLHWRSATNRGPVVSALHAGSLSCRPAIGAISVAGIFNSLCRVRRFTFVRLRLRPVF